MRTPSSSTCWPRAGAGAGRGQNCNSLADSSSQWRETAVAGRINQVNLAVRLDRDYATLQYITYTHNIDTREIQGRFSPSRTENLPTCERRRGCCRTGRGRWWTAPPHSGRTLPPPATSQRWRSQCSNSWGAIHIKGFLNKKTDLRLARRKYLMSCWRLSLFFTVARMTTLMTIEMKPRLISNMT